MKRLMALLLAFTLLMAAAVNLAWAAAADTPVMTVGSVEGRKGDAVTLYVTLKNNPGFSAASVKIDFDDTNITLTDAELCGDFAAGAFVSYENLPYITFVRSENVTDSEFLKLTFTIAESAELGDISVTVLYTGGDISDSNENDVDFRVVPGKISISEKTFETGECIPGDVTKDERVTIRDVSAIRLFLAGDLALTEMQQAAGDINQDGRVTIRDLSAIRLFLAGKYTLERSDQSLA